MGVDQPGRGQHQDGHVAADLHGRVKQGVGLDYVRHHGLRAQGV